MNFFKKTFLILPLFSFVSLSAADYDSETAKAIEASAKVEQDAQDAAQVGTARSSSSSTAVSISGFYGGIDLGVDVAKSKLKHEAAYSEAKDETKKNASKKNKSKSGFLGDVFVGYNCQFGKIMVGLECTVGMRGVKNEADLLGTSTKNNVSVKKKYSFGIAPRFGYAILDSLFGYVNVGTTLSKFKLKNQDKTNSTSTSKNSTKTAMFLGIGVEQNFGSLFIRGECNKVFDRHVGNLNGVKVSSGSYTFKIGGGYRF